MGQTESKPHEDVRVVIVGGVAAGASCAARCRRLSERASITLVEKGNYVSFANCGLPYFVGDKIHDESSLIVAKPQLFKSRFEIDVKLQTEAISIDANKQTISLRNTETGETEDLPYDYLVLTPGASPIRPPLPGIDLENVFSLRDIPDARNIKSFIEEKNAKRAVVVGGGFVGLEMVENLIHHGCQVELVEALPQVMGPLDPEMAELVMPVLEKHHVKVHLNEAVASFEKVDENSKEIEVVTKNGTRIRTDLVILGIGVRPNTAIAKTAGCKIGERNGIVVDSNMRTSVRNIFAAGDAVESTDIVTGQKLVFAMAGPANRQGRIIANNIFGVEPSKFRGVQGTSICGLFGTTIAMTGASEKSLRRANQPYNYIYAHPSNHASYYPGAERLHMKLLFEPKTGKILGAQAVGKDLVDKRIDAISMAIQGGMTCFDLEESELCYAPQFGSAKDPVNFVGMIAANAVRGIGEVTHWPETLAALQCGDITLLDVRSEEEFASGHAPSALNIPVHDLRNNLDKIPSDKPIHVYCLVGIRGYIAERILLQNGFSDVKNITGGWLSFPSSDIH